MKEMQNEKQKETQEKMKKGLDKGLEKSPVYVTQPSLAPLGEVVSLLEGVWDRGILTHNGPLVQQLEKELERELGVPRFVAVTNGTIALQMAIRALGLSGNMGSMGNMGNGGQPGGVVQPGHRGQPGEIIISSFTWIATVSAIKWEGCVPVCCDINPKTLNLDPAEIERHITERTVAIMPVHVFGNPCDVEAIEAVARKHDLKVIYDAAHAIGSTWKGESVLSWGDVSGTSLHATKLLNTGEGGGCITRDPGLWEKLERIRFFGHDAQKDIVEDGFNGKMTEVHAALGLANLRYYREVLADRKRKYALYLEMLDGVPGLEFQQMQPGGESNYSYFAVMFESEEVLLRVIEALAAVHVFPRRYFYPSVNRFTKVLAYRSTPVAEDISSRILCLPHYLGLKKEDMSAICDVIRGEVVRNL